MHRICVAAPAEKIYRAITTEEGIKGWWTTDVKMDTHAGGKAVFDEPVRACARAFRPRCSGPRGAEVRLVQEEGRRRDSCCSLPEQRFIETAQCDDGFECADRNLAPIGDRHSGAVAGGQLPPIDEMAASLVHEGEAMFAQKPAHFRSGERPEFRHGPVRGAGRSRPASAGA